MPFLNTCFQTSNTSSRIMRLDVFMDHAGGMDAFEGLANFAGDSQGGGKRQPFVLSEDPLEREPTGVF